MRPYRTAWRCRVGNPASGRLRTHDRTSPGRSLAVHITAPRDSPHRHRGAACCARRCRAHASHSPRSGTPDTPWSGRMACSPTTRWRVGRHVSLYLDHLVAVDVARVLVPNRLLALGAPARRSRRWQRSGRGGWHSPGNEPRVNGVDGCVLAPARQPMGKGSDLRTKPTRSICTWVPGGERCRGTDAPPSGRHDRQEVIWREGRISPRGVPTATYPLTAPSVKPAMKRSRKML